MSDRLSLRESSPTRSVVSAAWAMLREALPPTTTTAYVARTLLACALALYAAYALQLDSPGSAVTTVLIVANASHGALVSKSVWRLVGSTLGAIAAVTIVAGFAQSPFLYVIALGCWVGLCTMMASALRYNRGYAGVLAGYTVAIVALPAINTPNAIFDLALSRLSVVSLGVVSAGLVFMLTDPGKGAMHFAPALQKLVSGTCRLIADSFDSADLSVPQRARSAVAADITSLDQVVEFTNAVEAGFSRYAEDVRLAAAELTAMLVGGLRVGLLLHDLHHPDDRAAAATLRARLADIGDASAGTDAASLAVCAREARAAVQGALETTQDLRAVSGFDQALTLLGQLDEAIATMASLEAHRPRSTRLHLRIFIDWSTARRNGLRALLAICIAGLFWIESQWPSGGSMVLIIAVESALLSQTPSASAGSIAFFQGIAVMLVFAFFCSFAVLPRMSGFPLLLLGVLPFVAIGLVAQRIPRIATQATAALSLFFGSVAPDNPIVFNLAGTLNADLALLVGGGLAVLSFRILLPPDPVAEAGVVADSLRFSNCHRPASANLVFENMQHQKLMRMSQRLASRPDLRFAAVSEAVVLVLIGRQLQTIRIAATDPALPPPARAVAAEAGRAGRNLHRRPQAIAAAYAAEATRQHLAASALPQLRLAAALREAAALIEYDMAFLRGEGVLSA